MKEAISFLENLNIPKNRYIIIGCSGGPDSMCLLNVLLKMNFHIVCAHVDHGIRKESTQEYEFVEDFCQKNDITFEGMHIPKDLNKNESYYRRIRYDFYKKLAHKYNTPYIMTAHHGDDLIETILMRITRGSCLKGYLGFRKVYEEKEYVFIKPLIFYTKEEIMNYVTSHGIPYVIDSTNAEDNYTRNRYRHFILPFLKKEDGDVHRKYLKFSEELQETVEYIDFLVNTAIDDNFDGEKIDLDKFEQLDTFLQKKEIERILQKIYGDNVDKLKVSHITAIIEQLSKGTNFALDLPLNIKVQREYSHLTIGPLRRADSYKLELTDIVTLPNGGKIEKVSKCEDTSNFTTRLNSKDVHLPLYIRTRESNDSIEIKNMNGSKKIKKILIDEKIPPSIRSEIPILTDASGTILWLPGIKKSKFDINKDGKYDIILRYTQKKGKYK